ncbi:MAG: MFS transporter [Chloroflexi bacterium]|nr:MFS transporter [Chloroflexota bacterium]
MQHVFYGWKVLAAVAWLRVLAGGFHSFAFAVFFLPVSRDLNLSRTAASLIFSLARAEGAMEAPAAGYLIDRLGARTIMTAGCIVVGIGYLLLSRVYDFAAFVIVYILVISVGYGSAFVHSATALANHWFFRHRGLTLAITSASLSLGGALLAPVLALVINQYGWRTGAVLAGAVFLVAALPVTRLICSTPEERGLAPLGAPKEHPHGAPGAPRAPGNGNGTDFTVRQAMRTSAFWLLVGAGFLRMAGYSAVHLHFIPILVWKGVGEQAAAFYLGLMAAFAVPAQIVLGIIGDRYYTPKVLSVAMGVGAVGILFLLFGRGWSQYLFIPLVGVVEALFSLVWATLGDFYGRRHFATIRGYVTLFVTIGSMLGPVLAGMVYDRSGSYTVAIQFAAVSFVLSAAGFWLVRRPGKGVR